MAVDLLSLPWWAYGYIFLLCALTFVGMRTEKILFFMTPLKLTGHLLALCVSILCILAYCQPSLAQGLGVWVFGALVLAAMAFDFTQSVCDANRIEAEIRREGLMNDQERSVVINSGMLLGAVLIVPAYMMGLKVCFDLITGAAG